MLPIQFTCTLTQKGLARSSFSPSKRFSLLFNGYPSPSLQNLITSWIEGYRKGVKGLPLIPLDLPLLSPFTLSVLEEVQKIPFGERCSYGEIATKLQSPQGARAVGGACGRNPIPLIIPCHRVVAKNGRLGGFSCGLGFKRTLLDFEASFSPKKGGD